MEDKKKVKAKLVKKYTTEITVYEFICPYCGAENTFSDFSSVDSMGFCIGCSGNSEIEF